MTSPAGREARAYWSVEDGCLTGKADGTLKYNRFIVWRGGTVKNFELRVKVKVSPGGNSGLQYRGTERPDLGESVVTGYQCDVVANRPDYNGMLYEERGRRILATPARRSSSTRKASPGSVGQFPLKEFTPGEWHDYRVLAEGNHYRHWIDGHPTVDVTDLDEKGRKLEGVLAVQVHVGPPMTIQYKDFFLKALPDDLPLISPDQRHPARCPRRSLHRARTSPGSLNRPETLPGALISGKLDATLSGDQTFHLTLNKLAVLCFAVLERILEGVGPDTARLKSVAGKAELVLVNCRNENTAQSVFDARKPHAT